MAYKTLDAYGQKQLVVDTEHDLDLLPKGYEMGSLALVIATGDVYVLNSHGEWVKL